jgi:hypothetical protein
VPCAQYPEGRFKFPTQLWRSIETVLERDGPRALAHFMDLHNPYPRRVLDAVEEDLAAGAELRLVRGEEPHVSVSTGAGLLLAPLAKCVGSEGLRLARTASAEEYRRVHDRDADDITLWPCPVDKTKPHYQSEHHRGHSSTQTALVGSHTSAAQRGDDTQPPHAQMCYPAGLRKKPGPDGYQKRVSAADGCRMARACELLCVTLPAHAGMADCAPRLGARAGAT